MTSNHSENGHGRDAARYDTDGYAEQAGFADDKPKAADNPLLIVHRLLRGRYFLASILGVIFACVASYLAWSLYVVKYKSQGMLQVEPYREAMMYEDIPGFDMRESPTRFINTQVAAIQRNERIHDLAINEYGLKELGWRSDSDGRQALRGAMDVYPERNSHVITIAARHEQPNLAQQIVTAVMEAYLQYHAEQQGLATQRRESYLRSRVAGLRGEIEEKRGEMNEIRREYGTADNLDEQYQSLVEQRNQLQRSIEQLRVQAERLAGQPEEERFGIDVDQIPLERLANLDDQLRQRVRRRESANLALEQNLLSLGPEHRTIQRLEDEIKTLDRFIEQRAAEIRGKIARGEIVVDAEDMSVDALTPEQLEQQRQLYAETLQDIIAEEERLFIALETVDRLNDEVAITTTNLRDTRNLLEKIQVELSASGGSNERIGVMDNASAPERDTGKRVPMTAAAGMGGLGLGFALVGAWGLIDRRYRYVDELAASDSLPPLVGVIPRLNPKDKDSLKFAALAVHHVRNSLMLHHPPRVERGRLFTITSAAAGDGKTNLARALGRSFAESGYRTLLVDADLVGHGLTSDEGLEGRPGFVDLMRRDPNTEVKPVEAGLEKLHVLPAGRDLHAERLKREPLAATLDALRDDYEIVLVDTGPVMGSLEAGFVAVEADAVVAVISRWSDNKLVRVMTERLTSLGVRRAWAVFNKAEPQDATQSVSQGSLTSRSMRRQLGGDQQPTRRRGIQLFDALQSETAAGESMAPAGSSQGA